MTHPDILKMERFGNLNPNIAPRKTGVCLCCDAVLYDDMPEAIQSRDGNFCDPDCCREYYEIRRIR